MSIIITQIQMTGIWRPRIINPRLLIFWIILSSLLISCGVSENATGISPEVAPPFQISDNFSTLPYEEVPPPFPVSDNYSDSQSPTLVPDIESDEAAYIQPYQNSSILVRFDPRSDTLPLRIHSGIGAEIVHDYSADGIPGLELVKTPEQLSVEEAVAYYDSQPGVLFAEPDYYRFSVQTPSDPEFWRQWGLENTGQIYKENTPSGIPGSDIQAALAWDTETGGESIIAILDSGVDYLHPDLATNILTDLQNGTAGYDAITGEMDAMDLASHGTHCAGIAGAVGDDGLGITGVNWHTRILPVRFLNSFGTGTVSDEIEAILWATKNGARIISCSYGARTNSRAEYEVMKESDALFICAAGNSGVDTDITPYYPSSNDLPNIISVAATDSSDNLATFSNYGLKSVDLGAPGVDIFSTKHNIYQPEPIWNDSFESLQNWSVQGNWTLDTGQYVSPNTSASGTVNKSLSDKSRMPAMLTLKSPLKISDIANPVISYQWSLVATNYSFSIEGSNNGIAWQTLEYGRGDMMIAPFIKRECKIPAEMRDGHLFLRFSIDGDFCILGLDDFTLSDGYGTLMETRWGYMNGTSMACPQVSGIAVLLAAAAPDASLEDIRNAILNTADPFPSLSGKTVTGGRANLVAALERITGGSSYHLRLLSGWNHVSVPYRLISGNDTAGEIFGSLTNVSGHSLYRFEAGRWISVHPDERISPLTSYWVFTGSPASLPLMVEPNQSGIFSRNLTTGWNGFGMIGDESSEAKGVLEPLGDIWTYIIGFNSTLQISDEPIIRGGSGKQNDTRPLLPYQGYWVYLTRNGSYEKNGSNETEVIEEIAPLWPQPLK